MLRILKDFSSGPLDYYRKKSSFDWKKLKMFLDSEDIVTYEQELYQELQKYPEYMISNTSEKCFDEKRYLAAKQSHVYSSIKLLSLESLIQNLNRFSASLRIMMQFFPDSTIKYTVSTTLFTGSILNMGSDRHLRYITEIEDNKIIGSYCLTEIGHGSNTKGMKTTATYSDSEKEFILNSSNFEAAKCWAGGLGQCATHSIVYAKLILKGKDYGLHAFVVPIRDPKTLLPYPGLIVGDMGEKIGLNGLDNGFVVFNNYRIPRENLLNKNGDVTEDGQYVARIKDSNKRHGAALGGLSGGRVNISCICEAMGIKALTIAIRYAAVRKQFGPDENEEIPVLEYQAHQYRLLPYLAAAYVLRIFNTFFTEVYFQSQVNAVFGNNNKTQDLGMEIHIISSACKPLAGWIMKDAIQECRETCAGHGYLKASNIGDIRNDHDANLTYEGENHVLIQQTSNWLVKLWPLILNKEQISTPLHSGDFLTNALEILTKRKFTSTNIEEISCLNNIVSIYEWLVCYLLKISYDKVESQLKSGETEFWAKNNSQVFYAKNLTIAFIQLFFIRKMIQKIAEAEDQAIKIVLQNLGSLYGLWSLEKHIPMLYQGNFFQTPEATFLVHEAILKLCNKIKDDAVSLIDVVAPPDFVLNSVLGASDGQVYNRLQSAMVNSRYGMQRPTWWKEIINRENKSKL